MAKSIRAIKNTFCEDETLGNCTRDARLLFAGLITRVDDHGRFRAHPAFVRGQVFPYDDDLTSGDVERLILELAVKGRVTLYEVDGQRYGYIPSWTRHQRIDNAAKSELPEPPAADCGEPPLGPGGGGAPVEHPDSNGVPVDNGSRCVVEDTGNVDAESMRRTAANHGELPLEGKGKEYITPPFIPPQPPAADSGEPPRPAESEPPKPDPDDVLTALAEACRIDLTRTPGGALIRYRKLAHQLVAIGATPDDVRARAETARRTWRHGMVTPDAVLKRWAELAPPVADVVQLRTEPPALCRWCNAYLTKHHTEHECSRRPYEEAQA